MYSNYSVQQEKTAAISTQHFKGYNVIYTCTYLPAHTCNIIILHYMIQIITHNIPNYIQYIYTVHTSSIQIYGMC